MNSNGQATAHHWGWMIVILIIFGVCAYIWSINRPDIENYGKGSYHSEAHRQDWPFSIHIGEGGCQTVGEMIKHKISKDKEDGNHGIITNIIAK